MIFQTGNTYYLGHPDFSSLIINTQFDTEIQNMCLFYTFLNDRQYNTNIPYRKPGRYNFIKALFYPQIGSVLNFMFLPSDPDELVHQLKLIQFEKEGGNDNPQLNGPIIAITDMLLEYECITTNQHQNITSISV